MGSNPRMSSFQQPGSSATHPSTTVPKPDNPGPPRLRVPIPMEPLEDAVCILADHVQAVSAYVDKHLVEATKQQNLDETTRQQGLAELAKRQELAEQRHLESLAASICAVFATNLDLMYTTLIARKALEIAKEIVELNRSETP